MAEALYSCPYCGGIEKEEEIRRRKKDEIISLGWWRMQLDKVASVRPICSPFCGIQRRECVGILLL